MSLIALRAAAAAALGPDAVRDPVSGEDNVDGVMPRVVVEPATAEGVAAALAWARQDKLLTVIRGGGTKQGWGRLPDRVDVLLGLRRLDRVIAHAHDDLTVTVEAGATLDAVNRRLAAHGQWLPFDPPFASQATIGGLLATNDAGPLRHRSGTPRDLVLGSRIATADGRLSKSGGQVVKNVAGYDVSKLLAGSCGALAAYVSATFKVSPRPDVSATLLVTPRDLERSASFVRAVQGSQLEPAALDLALPVTRRSRQSTLTVLVRFASVHAAVDAQIAAATALAVAAGDDQPRVAVESGEAALWATHAEAAWRGDGAVVRLGWRPADLAAAAREITRLSDAADLAWIGRAGVGAGLLRIDADLPVQASIIGMLRGSSVFGNVVVVRASGALKARVDVWGPAGDRAGLFAAIKHQFDPDGILNAGRGPL